MADTIKVSVGAEDKASGPIAAIGDAAKRVASVIGSAMSGIGSSFGSALGGVTKLTGAMNQFSSRAEGAAGAAGDIGGALEGIADAQQLSAERASRHARALSDVEQAMLDATQATTDLKQAEVDLTQSTLDASQAQEDFAQSQVDTQQANLNAQIAQRDYVAAVKEFGVGSIEAQQAQIDLTQAQRDATQAAIDSKQAEVDLTQATVDGEQAMNDSSQAAQDAKDSTLDLADAKREASAGTNDLKVWGQNLNAVAPIAMGAAAAVQLLSGATTVLTGSFVKNAIASSASRVAMIAGAIGTGIAAAAQWVMNLALWACPLTWIIAGIMLLIGVIVLIATKTTWFQQLWAAIWGAIGEPLKAAGAWIASAWSATVDFLGAAVGRAKDMIVGAFRFAINFVIGYFNLLWSIPGRIGSAFASVGSALYAPFRWAFNAIAGGWNRTVGNLRFSVPSWVPEYGGNSFSVPKVPMLQSGGNILRQGFAYLHAGERVMPAADVRNLDGKGETKEIRFSGNTDSAFAKLFMELVRTGKIQLVM